MPRDANGVYSKPTGTTAVPGATIESARYNQVVDDLVVDANAPRPIVAGGTGASSAAGARTALGGTATGVALFTAASGAAARGAISAPPTPQFNAGAGQYTALFAAANNTLTLPPGGTWAWFLLQRRVSDLGVGTCNAGIGSGGSILATSNGSVDHFGFAWRIA